ncbi:MAG: Rab family GTPase, partial [Hyphomicrobiaceae bacterium]
DMGVGKTSIARRLAFGTFGGEYQSTIGVEILTYDIESGPGGVPFKFLIWDTDGSFGEAIFETVYLNQAQAALFVGDVARPATLESIASLAKQFDGRLPGRYSAVVLNKIDLLRQDQKIEMPGSLTTPDRTVVETSAKTGHGVVELFHTAAETIVRRGLHQ